MTNHHRLLPPALLRSHLFPGSQDVCPGTFLSHWVTEGSRNIQWIALPSTPGPLCAHTYVHARIHAYIHEGMHAHVHTDTCTHMNAGTCVHTDAHIHTCTLQHLHTHTFTHVADTQDALWMTSLAKKTISLFLLSTSVALLPQTVCVTSLQCPAHLGVQTGSSRTSSTTGQDQEGYPHSHLQCARLLSVEGHDPIAQGRKLRLRKLRGLPKAHTARERWGRIGTQEGEARQ